MSATADVHAFNTDTENFFLLTQYCNVNSFVQNDVTTVVNQMNVRHIFIQISVHGQRVY